MMHLLEKTNERITLDRQFLISEKMDVIIKEVQHLPLLKINKKKHQKDDPREILFNLRKSRLAQNR
jgi:hypothetical protein